ncbi:hypothetical protein [Frankia sp. CcWB2]
MMLSITYLLLHYVPLQPTYLRSPPCGNSWIDRLLAEGRKARV